MGVFKVKRVALMQTLPSVAQRRLPQRGQELTAHDGRQQLTGCLMWLFLVVQETSEVFKSCCAQLVLWGIGIPPGSHFLFFLTYS